jgi:type VI secretion system protein ImpL
MLFKDIIRVVIYGVGLTSLSALVYLAGPFVAFGDYRPLDNYIIRELVILLLVAGVGGLAGFRFWKRRKGANEIAQGITAGEEGQAGSDASVLKDRMKDALATLKSSARGKKGDVLYELPWYLLIGPPGSGKTTALVNSGLKFPLSRGATPAAIAGVGGTRYCDWWFTEDAVLIDTAGRYTTQDSDMKADQQSWLAFLELLTKNRPRQPINGVIVAISLEDLITLKQDEITAHAIAIRSRLLELHDRLKVDFPVYCLFTKADLVAGFLEFFGNLNDTARAQVWGATFQTDDKKATLVGEMPGEFDALIQRLNEELLDRLQDEPVPNSRVALFGFPSQMAALRRPIHNFLNQIFEPTRYHADATLRGFYFSSGTQEGTPIDQVIGALARSFGAEQVASASYSGRGKSFFLTDLITKVIIGEAAWVTSDRAAVRRAFFLKAAAMTAIFLVAITMLGAWWISYMRNAALIAETNAAVRQYQAEAAPLVKQTKISDRDFGPVARALHRLRYLPAGYGNRDVPTPMASTFGLSQRERLESSAETAYHTALERMYRPRLLFRLEELLDASKDRGDSAYEPLKVYLMLGKQHKPENGLLLSFMKRDWERNLYPGAGNEGGRKSLQEHLEAMLDLDEGDALPYGLHGPLVTRVQQTLARMSVAERAYELLKSQAHASNGPDWVALSRGGVDFPIVFDTNNREPIQNVRVPYFFTYNGFRDAFLARLGDIADQIKRDRWILGQAGEQSAVEAQYRTLGPDLLRLYTRDFIAEWRTALAKLKLKPLMADKPQFTVLGALSSPTSPLKELLESVRDETALTRERKAPAAGGKPAAGGAPANAVRTAGADSAVPALLTQQDRAPGAEVEAAFKASDMMLVGTPPPIDGIMQILGEIRRNLTLLATDPTMAAQATTQLKLQVSNLRASANIAPSPWRELLTSAAAQFEGEVNTSSRAELERALGEVTGACRGIINGRYPFFRDGRAEVPLIEFGRLFGTGGILDRFYKEHLAGLVDTSHAVWRWRADNPIARQLSQASLVEFQRAADIRDAFFSTGGNMPSVSLTVVPPPPGPGGAARLDINGTVVESRTANPTPVPVQWPGAGINRSAVTLGGDFMGPPSVIERQGVWSLFRLTENARQYDGRVVADFFLGGQNLRYQFIAATIKHPLSLPALHQFRCPASL